MSNLTRCNYCTLQALRQVAKESKRKLVLIEGRTPSGQDGWDLGEGWDQGEPLIGTEVQIGGRFAAWMQVIPDHCVCRED